MPAEFCRSHSHTASKRYVCDLCSRVIPKGKKYISTFGRDGAKTFNIKVCYVCAKAAGILGSKDG